MIKRKAESTMISLKVENDRLARFDRMCHETGVSRTTAIEKAIDERLTHYMYTNDQTSLRYLQQSGQWYEWNDEEGHWCLPGCSGILSDGKGEDELPIAVKNVYKKFYGILDTGDYKKLVTCKGVHGIALIWTFSRLFFDRSGQSHDHIEPYIKETIAQMKRRCRRGMILADIGDDGVSDYRIYWFVPGGSVMDLDYADMLNARKIMNDLFDTQR